MKPENILFTRDSIPKVSDFNTAKIISRLTRSQASAYTPGYAAPEQLSGIVTKTSDVWAIGVILHKMLTGRIPEWLSTSSIMLNSQP